MMQAAVEWLVRYDAAAALAKHAIDDRPVPAKLLGAVEPVGGDGDPRQALAAWIRDPANELFNRNIVNRLWARLLGTGIVEPVDDFRATNPPSNRLLLDALVARFKESGRRLRPIIRDICTSRIYQLSAVPTPAAIIEAVFIRVLSRRPTAEELEALGTLVAESPGPAVYEDIFAGLIDSSEFLYNNH